MNKKLIKATTGLLLTATVLTACAPLKNGAEQQHENKKTTAVHKKIENQNKEKVSSNKKENNKNEVEQMNKSENKIEEENITETIVEATATNTDINDLSSKYTKKKADKARKEKVSKVTKKIKKESKNVTEYMVKRAFIEAKEYMPKNSTMEDYYTKVASILAIIKVESNFTRINCTNTNKSVDYGLMQINQVCFDYIEQHTGITPYQIKNTIKYNIQAGTFMLHECIDRACKDADDKHEQLYWTYAYYNRGLYFKKSKNWYSKIDQINRNSGIFLDAFYKNYDFVLKA